MPRCRQAVGTALVSVEQTALNIAISAATTLHEADAAWAAANGVSLAAWLAAIVSAVDVGATAVLCAFAPASGQGGDGAAGAEPLVDMVQAGLQRLIVSLAARFEALTKRVNAESAIADTGLGFHSPRTGYSGDPLLPETPRAFVRRCSSLQATLRHGDEGLQKQDSETGEEAVEGFGQAGCPKPYRADINVPTVEPAPRLVHPMLALACRVRLFNLSSSTVLSRMRQVKAHPGRCCSGRDSFQLRQHACNLALPSSN